MTLDATQRANFDRWAEGAVHPDDVQKFVHADVTMGQVMAFIKAAVPRQASL